MDLKLKGKTALITGGSEGMAGIADWPRRLSTLAISRGACRLPRAPGEPRRARLPSRRTAPAEVQDAHQPRRSSVRTGHQ